MEPGSLWRHYKGGLYRLVVCGRLEATKEPHVVYVSAETFPYGEHWIRPLTEWGQEVAPGVRRFTQIPSQEV